MLATLNVSPAETTQLINFWLAPKQPLDSGLLEKLVSVVDENLTKMLMATVAAGIDIQKIGDLTVLNVGMPREGKTQVVAQKLFSLFNQIADKHPALKGFLNESLPYILNSTQIKAALNANPSNMSQIMSTYMGPLNPQRRQFIEAQNNDTVNTLILGMSEETLNNIAD